MEMSEFLMEIIFMHTIPKAWIDQLKFFKHIQDFADHVFLKGLVSF